MKSWFRLTDIQIIRLIKSANTQRTRFNSAAKFWLNPPYQECVFLGIFQQLLVGSIIRTRCSTKVRKVAGMVGFEPTVHCTKNSCLTTWLHPNVETLFKVLWSYDQVQKNTLVNLSKWYGCLVNLAKSVILGFGFGSMHKKEPIAVMLYLRLSLKNLSLFERKRISLMIFDAL